MRRRRRLQEIPLQWRSGWGGVAVWGGMAMADKAEVLKVFDAAIEDLVNEIKELEEGLHDHQLEYVASYPLKPEFMSLGLYCRFPHPPRFPVELPVKGNLKIDEAIFASAAVPTERRPTRVIKKRKLDGEEDDSEEHPPSQKTPIVDTTPPAPKPPGRRPGRPRLTDRVPPPSPSPLP